MRLSLRNLMWLTLLLTVGMAWGVEHYRAEERLQEVRQEPARWLYVKEEAQPQIPRASFLAEASNQELINFINRQPHWVDPEPCLIEALRRGLKHEIAESFATHKLAWSSPSRNFAECNMVDKGESRNVDCLTVLRRAFGKTDPIKISIRSVGADSQGKPLSVPLIIPCLENVDVERETCILATQLALDDPWKSRHTNWRVLLTNERGELMEEIGPGPEHSFHDTTAVPFGEKVEGYQLDARSYLKPPPSGHYTLQLIYDHDQSLVNADLTQRIVWKSDPVKVIVTNRTLTSQWEAVVAPNVILCSTLTVIMGLGILTYSKRVSPRVCDWLALAMLALLATSWSLDLFRIKDEIAELTVDANSAWSMRLEK